jgi:hypothetical protein
MAIRSFFLCATDCHPYPAMFDAPYANSCGVKSSKSLSLLQKSGQVYQNTPFHTIQLSEMNLQKD